MINTIVLQQELIDGINYSWILTVSFLIFFMHAGFAMLESGQVRSKNVANQLTKNLLTWSVGVVVFFLIGVGVSEIAAGGSFGAGAPFLADGATHYIDWLYSAVFAMTAATIVSGAVAGRAKLRAYVTYTFLLAAVVYPVVIGFTWVPQAAEDATGLVEQVVGVAFADFAGGMIVHGLGGIAGLTAAWVLGPRLDKYDSNGRVNVIPGHSMTFAVLGTLLLAFGWYGFNVGTASVIDDGAFNGATLGRVAMATTLAMAMGTVGAGLVSWLRTRKIDTLYLANGLLAGLVGITAIPDAATWWGALLVGLLAGGQLPIVFRFVEKRLKIDDVCAVFPVHGSAGVLGTLAFPFVAADLSAPIGQAFLAQLFGVLVISAWTVTATAVIWGAFKLLDQARVTEDEERRGLDIAEHGVETYPEFGNPDVATDGGAQIVDLDDPTYVPDGGLTEIELVMAVIRPEKLDAVKTSLLETGVQSLTVTDVSGRGTQFDERGQWRGESYTIDLHKKTKIECVVADVPTEAVVTAITDSAQTGEPGDGKVFVLPVTDAQQIRTGKRGPEAV